MLAVQGRESRMRLGLPCVTLLGVFWGAGACTGSILNPQGEQNGSPDDPGNQSNDNGDGVIAGPIAEAKCPLPKAPPQAGSAPVRRLTRDEYNSTVRDLLGDESRPADSFAPETEVHGFTNNVATQAVTFTLADDYFRSAQKLAATAVGRLDTIAPCDVSARGEHGCARSFISGFGLRAYRRPLEPAEVDGLFETYEQARTGADHSHAMRLLLTRMLGSPSFLYRPENGVTAGKSDSGLRTPSPYEMATRLSYLLWGTMPDDELFAAAAADALGTEEALRGQVARMLASPRAKEAVRRFYSGWLKLGEISRADKDETLFPGFKKVAPAMSEEVTRLVDHVIWEGEGRLADLFTADYSFLNQPLAAFLGIKSEMALSNTFERVTMAPASGSGPAWRAGVLSTAGILAAHGKALEHSPILRGRFIAEQILCLEVPLPPGDVPPVPPADGSDLTTRERFEEHSKAACASCHKIMDPLGFAFENFDTVGRFRAEENGKPIDASGTLTDTDVDGAFGNGIELSQKIASSQQMRSCVAVQLMRYGLGRDRSDLDERALQQMACALNNEGATLLEAFEALVLSDAFRYIGAADAAQ